MLPSSNKTLRLELNKWLGSDKPKKDDFNADNQKLDTAWGQLADQLGQLAQSQQSGHDSSAQAVAAIGNSVASHIENAAVHVTASEKEKWNAPTSGGFTIGTYVGDGYTTQTITLGFRPQLAIVFPASTPPVRFSPVTSQVQLFCAFMSDAGASEGVEPTLDGFRVWNANNGMEAYSIKMNATSQTYIYAAWR